jgi:hypothetical protein
LASLSRFKGYVRLTAAVDTNVAGSRETLHGHLEVVDVLVLQDQVDHAAGVRKVLVAVVGQVALQAPGVVAQPIAVGDVRAVGQTERHGAQVDRHVGEGPGLDTTTACSGWDRDLRETVSTENDLAASGDELAVAGHGELGAVEHGRVFEARDGGLGPVPVWLVALVAALVSERLLVLPCEVTMPS